MKWLVTGEPRASLVKYECLSNIGNADTLRSAFTNLAANWTRPGCWSATTSSSTSPVVTLGRHKPAHPDDKLNFQNQVNYLDFI